MNVMTDLQTYSPAGVSVVETSGGLEQFMAECTAATIWNRLVPREVLRWIAACAPENLPFGRLILRPQTVAKTVRGLCTASEMPAGAELDWFAADVAELAARFAGLMDAPYLRLRLNVVNTNACRKFHVDAIKGRLVCTYRGTGTQYGIGRPDQDPARIFTVPTGAPVLLRGSLWPETPRSGLLHRSPPIEGTGETRLVLVLDPIEHPEDEI